MPGPILLCTDGSKASMDALSSGLALLGREHTFVIVVVTDEPEFEATVGAGHAGPDMTWEEYEHEVSGAREAARRAIQLAQEQLSVDAQARVLHGDPGKAICQLATETVAQAVVLGTRGRGGLKRAVLGSVSDFVVRNASCTVVVTNASASASATG